jgi:hypothetical protein
MKQNKEKASKNETWLVIGFMIACCLAPILFIGMTGAWLSSLTAKETVPLVFFVLTLVLSVLGIVNSIFQTTVVRKIKRVFKALLNKNNGCVFDCFCIGAEVMGFVLVSPFLLT